MATTLLQLRTAARRRADQEGSTFVSDEELTRYVNESLRALYLHLASFYGDDYVAVDEGITLEAGEYEIFYLNPGGGNWLTYGLHKLLRLSWRYNDIYYPIRRLNSAEAVLRNSNTQVSWTSGVDICYRASADRIQLFPTPSALMIVNVRYIPRLADLSADGDNMNATLERWSEYVIVDAAIKLMEKEESDASALMAERERQLGMIKASAPDIDAFSPPCVTDARSNEDYSTWDDWRWSR